MEHNPDKQQKKTLPAKEAHTLLVDLMHEGYDTYCSEIDSEGNLTVIWPASTNVGKQFKKEAPGPKKSRRTLTKAEKKEYNSLASSARQMTISDFIGGNL